MERTLVLVKPDGVQRGLIGEVIARLERRGLRLVDPKPGAKVAAFHPPADGNVWPGHAGLLDVTEGQSITIELAFTQIASDDAEVLAAIPITKLAGFK